MKRSSIAVAEGADTVGPKDGQKEVEFAAV